MTFSLRRTATILVIASVAIFATSYVMTGVSICPNLSSCAAAVVMSDLDQNGSHNRPSIIVAQSTPASLPPVPPEYVTVPTALELGALYAILIAIIILAILEYTQPYFFKRFEKKHNFAR